MSDSKEKLGTPFKPLAVKCASIGRPKKDAAYQSIVAMDGRQFCFSITLGMAELMISQLTEFVLSHPDRK